MSSLATTLQELYEAHRDPARLDEAAAMYRDCLDLMPQDDPDYPGQQSNLANTLIRKCEVQADPDIAREAVEFAEAALRGTPTQDADILARLVNLGGAWMNAARVSATLLRPDAAQAASKATDAYQRALSRTPAGHPLRPLIEQMLVHVRVFRRAYGL